MVLCVLGCVRARARTCVCVCVCCVICVCVQQHMRRALRRRAISDWVGVTEEQVRTCVCSVGRWGCFMIPPFTFVLLSLCLPRLHVCHCHPRSYYSPWKRWPCDTYASAPSVAAWPNCAAVP